MAAHLQELPDGGFDALRQTAQVHVEHAEHGLLALVGGRLQLRPEASHLHTNQRWTEKANCVGMPDYHSMHFDSATLLHIQLTSSRALMLSMGGEA